MKVQSSHSRARCRGSLTAELFVAITLLTAAVVPLAGAFLQEQRRLRHAYYQAAAMELVDGEAEILAAGALSNFPEGEQVYPISYGSATNLPTGRFVLRRTGAQGSLEWQPKQSVHGGPVKRAFRLTYTGGVR